MPSISTEPTTSGARRTEQVAVLLDEGARILSVNTGLAGNSFLGLAARKQCELHDQLHPGCDADCQFSRLWKPAWRELRANDSVEWEIQDTVLGKFLRLHLARPPSARDVERERRQGFALLTITDITRHRLEYESLVRRERTLLKLLRERGVNPDNVTGCDVDVPDPSAVTGAAGMTLHYRATSRQAILAQENERRRIATELHDSLAQAAGVIKYNIEAAVARLSREQQGADLSPLDGVVEQVRELVDEIRRISNNLAPSMLDDFGLCAALRGLCSEFRSPDRQLHPACDTCIDESRLPDIVRFTAYRVAQEALNNIAKHSSATEASVDLVMTDGNLQLSVRDNGQGFEVASLRESGTGSGGAGLRNMRDRVIATGGEFSIESAPGKGAAIRATWPRSSLDLLGDEPVLYGIDGDR